MEYLVSVIIPVYNIEKYIYECLKSIQQQTYKKLEVVIVDDGSSDSTGKICDEFCANDYRFSVIHQENHGQAHARNVGKSLIHGEYLTYVDGDDLIHPEMIHLLVETQKSTNANVVQGIVKAFHSSAARMMHTQKQPTHLDNIIENYNSQEALTEYLYTRKFINGPVCKLIKSELMSNLDFPINCGYEDGAIMYKLYGEAKSLSYIPIALYFYRQHNSSTMHTSFNEKKLDRIKNSNELRQYIWSNYSSLKKASATRYCLAQMQILMWLPFEKKYKSIRQESFSKIVNNRKTVILDKQAPRQIKLLLFFSYLGCYTTMMLGRCYRFATRQ